MKMKAMYLMVVALVMVAFVGCSDKDDPAPSGNKEALKVTVTSSSAFTTDGSEIRVSVGSHDGKNPQTWKVNGADGSPGQVIYMVNSEYFVGGKTAVLQSPSNYMTASINISAFSIKQPFTITYKIEQGGKVLVEKTEEVKTGATPITAVFNY
ncbi:hypothetical protein ACR782_10300 [Sphingobacterium spiritivorum]|uniref:hypothetical protein n=1 Tax=Sphingobacterium spiritivorum TaxID=258 RepID=UPI003DA298FC